MNCFTEYCQRNAITPIYVPRTKEGWALWFCSPKNKYSILKCSYIQEHNHPSFFGFQLLGCTTNQNQGTFIDHFFRNLKTFDHVFWEGYDAFVVNEINELIAKGNKVISNQDELARRAWWLYLENNSRAIESVLSDADYINLIMPTLEPDISQKDLNYLIAKIKNRYFRHSWSAYCNLSYSYLVPSWVDKLTNDLNSEQSRTLLTNAGNIA